MRFTFRALARSDFDLLARWLADPLVHRWWHHEYTLEAVERDFGPTVDRVDPSAMHLVLPIGGGGTAGRPIGLIQSYRIGDYPEYVDELSALMDVPADAASIDYLIGEPDFRGRGLGKAMIAAYVEQLWVDDPAINSLIVPVAAANITSWKALAGAGFVKLGEGDLEPDNPIDEPLHVIMGINRPRLRPPGDGPR